MISFRSLFFLGAQVAIAAKRPDVITRVADALRRDNVRFSDHAIERMDERLHEFGLDENDVFRVLGKGWREEEKDEWDELHQEWNYAFRGKTIDAVELSISVALKAGGVLVITVINLELR